MVSPTAQNRSSGRTAGLLPALPSGPEPATIGATGPGGVHLTGMVGDRSSRDRVVEPGSVGPDGPGRVRVVGPGRAGGALARALAAVGHDLLAPVGRHDDPTDAARDVDLVVIATPDADIATVATGIRPHREALVIHLAGALGPEVLGEHPRRGVLHPLVSIPDPVTGAARLRDGAWFATDADESADRHRLERLAEALGGRPVHVSGDHRTAYHAAAVVASNHLVALIGQVERIAGTTGVPLAAYLGLARHTLDGLDRLAPAEALTGPVARGDWATVEEHLDALAPGERPAYAALAEAAAILAGSRATVPAWLVEARRGLPEPHDPPRDHGSGDRR